jgi:hypothetical protein
MSAATEAVHVPGAWPERRRAAPEPCHETSLCAGRYILKLSMPPPEVPLAPVGLIPVNPGIQPQRLNFSGQGLAGIVTKTLALPLVEPPPTGQVLDGRPQDNDDHRFLSPRIRLASSHGTNSSLPAFRASSLARSTSPCQSDDSYSASLRLRSSQSSSIARSFSRRVSPSNCRTVFTPASCAETTTLSRPFSRGETLRPDRRSWPTREKIREGRERRSRGSLHFPSGPTGTAGGWSGPSRTRPRPRCGGRRRTHPP